MATKKDTAETPGLTKEQNEANSLNMGGGGDVVLNTVTEVEDRYEAEQPVGGDGKNPPSPNNPPKKALLGEDRDYAAELGGDAKKSK